MRIDDVQELPGLFELLLIDMRAAHKIRNRVLEIFGDLDLVDIEYNSNSDCLEFVFDVDDGYAGRIDTVHGKEELLKRIREDNE